MNSNHNQTDLPKAPEEPDARSSRSRRSSPRGQPVALSEAKPSLVESNEQQQHFNNMLSQMTFGAKKAPEEEIARDYPHQVADGDCARAQAPSNRLAGQTG